MRRFLIITSIIMIACIVAGFGILIKVLASDTTNAQYRTDVVVTNTGTAVTPATANFTLSTAQMIAAGMLNATATDVAALIDGSDTYVMPGYGTSPWIVWLDTISAVSTKNVNIYSGNVTGGEIVWFPDPTADPSGSILDNASLELGANYTIEMYGYLNTTGNFFFKTDAAFADIEAGVIRMYNYGGATYDLHSSTVATGLHKVEFYQNSASTNMTIEVDDVIVGSINCASQAVPDNANNWKILGRGAGYNSAFTFVEYIKIYVGGQLRAYYYWEYGPTFSDHGDDATSCTLTPVSRTTANDADLSAVVVSQESLVEGSTPEAAAAGSGWDMISTTPYEPAGIYDEGGTSYPGSDLIIALEDDMRYPSGSIAIVMAFITAGIAGAVAFRYSHVEKRGIKGSLMIMCGVIEGVLVFWYIIGGGVVPGWVLIPFGIFSALLLLWRNPFSPVS